MIKQAFYALGLSSVLFLTAAPQAVEANVQMQSILQQERTWAGLETKTIQVENIKWAYSDGGAKDKPVIILIHGLSGTRDNWNRVARYLTPHYRVIIPDLPEHGDTKVPDDFDLSIPNLTEKLRRFAEAIHVEQQPHIAGHSMGGAIAMLYTGQYPLNTKSLFLVSAAGIYKSGNTPFLKNPSSLSEMIVTKSGDFDRVFQLVSSKPPFVPKEIKSEQEKLMISQSKGTRKMINSLINMSKSFSPDSFALLARTIDIPTLILWGKEDKIINAEVAQELKSLIKTAREPIIMQGIGHLPILEAEQLLVEHYLKFLKDAQTPQKPVVSPSSSTP